MNANLFFTFLMLLLSASGAPGGTGRGNDLLDLVPTAAYWRVQGVAVTRAQLEADVGQAKVEGDVPKLVKDLESLSRREKARQQLEAIGGPALEALRAEAAQAEDPEAATIARDLITSISARGKAAGVRRLMAIRTLGERKEKESAAVLKGLLDSKEMFVAEYAERALAALEGREAAGVDHRGELAKDLEMLPATTGIVLQTTGLGMPGFNVEAMAALANGAAPAGAPGAKEEAVDRLTRNVLEYAEAVGNVRADGMTLAISADIGGQNEWVLISVHGQYDRETVGKYVEKMMGRRGGATMVRKGEMMILNLDREAQLLMPSDRQMILVTANPANTPAGTVVEPLMDALTGGKAGGAGGLAENKVLAELIKGVDKTGVIWAAGIPSVGMKREAVFGAFDTLTLAAKEEKDGITLTATGRGTGNAAAAAEELVMMQKRMAEGVAQLAARGQAKELQPLLAALQSVKVTVEEKGATATAKVPRDLGRSLVGLIMQSMAGVGRPMPREVIEDFDEDLP